MIDIEQEIKNGRTHKEILDKVKAEIYQTALILTRGNQTRAAAMLKANRGTLRKYAEMGEIQNITENSA